LELHPDKTRLIEFGRHAVWRVGSATECALPIAVRPGFRRIVTRRLENAGRENGHALRALVAVAGARGSRCTRPFAGMSWPGLLVIHGRSHRPAGARPGTPPSTSPRRHRACDTVLSSRWLLSVVTNAARQIAFGGASADPARSSRSSDPVDRAAKLRDGSAGTTIWGFDPTSLTLVPVDGPMHMARTGDGSRRPGRHALDMWHRRMNGGDRPHDRPLADRGRSLSEDVRLARSRPAQRSRCIARAGRLAGGCC
jgi:hypothetical protein